MIACLLLFTFTQLWSMPMPSTNPVSDPDQASLEMLPDEEPMSTAEEPMSTANDSSQPLSTQLIPAPQMPVVTPSPMPQMFPVQPMPAVNFSQPVPMQPIQPQPIQQLPVAPAPQLSQPQTGSVVAEQLAWPNTIELSEEKTAMISNPVIAQHYASAKQSCRTMDALLKNLDQTIDSIKTMTQQKLSASSATSQLVNIDIGKLQELFNPREKNQ